MNRKHVKPVVCIRTCENLYLAINSLWQIIFTINENHKQGWGLVSDLIQLSNLTNFKNFSLYCCSMEIHVNFLNGQKEVPGFIKSQSVEVCMSVYSSSLMQYKHLASTTDLCLLQTTLFTFQSSNYMSKYCNWSKPSTEYRLSKGGILLGYCSRYICSDCDKGTCGGV